MVVSTPDKALLLVLWQITEANGRPSMVSLVELADRIRQWQEAGIRVYAADSTDEVCKAVGTDAEFLAHVGFLRLGEAGNAAELTQVGQMVASTLELPLWAQHRMAQAERELLADS